MPWPRLKFRRDAAWLASRNDVGAVKNGIVAGEEELSILKMVMNRVDCVSMSLPRQVRWRGVIYSNHSKN